MHEIVAGIDLGTTYSAIAYVDEQGTARVIPNAEGKTATPSVVMLDGDRATVGEVALNQWISNEEHVVRWIKREMGTGEYRFRGRSAVEISAEILKYLKASAEAHLGQEVREAVITCPAYFASIEIENTKAAGELAGLRVREIVKEPTAAAVYFGIENMRPGETVLVCDLGGGTYDATILRYEKGTFTPLATMGDRRLGGHDWTMELQELVVDRMKAAHGEDPRDDVLAAQMLYEACEQAKRDFARVSEIAIPCQRRGTIEHLKISREDFEDRTAKLIQRMVMRTEEARVKSGLPWSAIDRILLVGGSSRLQAMGAALESATGKRPLLSREPDLMVALGAAVLAKGRVRPRKMAGLTAVASGGLTEIEVKAKRTIPRSLGTRVIVFDPTGPRIKNASVIPPGTETPVSRSRTDFTVPATGQKHFDVPVIEFEDDDDFDVVGNFRFACLPSARRGDRITVTFHYDLSGIVTVEACDAQSGRSLSVERLPYSEPNLEEVARVSVRPRWVVFAIDASSSMDDKIAVAKQAVLTNAESLIASGAGACRVGIVSFASGAEVRCPPTDDPTEIRRSVEAIQPGGTTAMDAGIREAAGLVSGAPIEAGRDIVLVTDGFPDSRDNTLSAAADTKRKGIKLLNVGLEADGMDLSYLKQISDDVLIVSNADGGALNAGLFTLLSAAAAKSA